MTSVAPSCFECLHVIFEIAQHKLIIFRSTYFLDLSQNFNLAFPDVKQLQEVIKVLQHRTSIVSSRLVRQLKRRDHRLVRLQKNCDVLTAVLQAASLKRSKLV